MIGHFGLPQECKSWIAQFITIYSFHCVEVFFALSGFGMTLSYRDRVSKLKFVDYLKLKIRKFYPIYLTTLVIGAVLYLWLKVTYPPSSILANILAMFLLGEGMLTEIRPCNYPLWFMSSLMLCYLYFYFVCRNAGIIKRYKFLILAVIIISGIGITMRWNFPFFYFYRSLRGLISFFIGMLFAEVYVENVSKKYFFSFLFISCSGITIFTYLYYHSLVSTKLIVICMILLPLVLYFSLYNNYISRILSCKPLLFLAKSSMSIYMWHACVQFIVDGLFPGRGIHAYFLFYLISILLGIVSSSYLEPMLNRFVAKAGWFRCSFE